MGDTRDIVERLRFIYATHPMVIEAAAEITRLRAEVAELRERLAGPAWEATEHGLTKYVTDQRYRKFAPAIQRWYKPMRCSSCDSATAEAMARAAQIAEDTEPPKSIGRDKGRHHQAGAQHAAARIRQAARGESGTSPVETVESGDT